MKKLIVTFALIISALAIANGQFTKVGGGLGFNSGFHFNDESGADHKTGNPIIFLTGIYELSLPIHISPSLNIYIPNITKSDLIEVSDKISVMAYSLDVNGHYVFNSLDRFEFYGLAGLNFLLLNRKTTYSSSTSNIDEITYKESDNALGLNLGAGSYIKVRETFDLFVELKGIVNKQFQFVATGGILLNIDWMKKHQNSDL
jgi:opacity protein-like surface antigen